jgi:tetratricopeptide (TPR) repeat protein
MHASAVAKPIRIARPRALGLTLLALALVVMGGCGKQQQRSDLDKARQAADRAPNSVEAQLARDRALLDEARRAADRAPNSVEAQLALGRALYKDKRYNDAFIALTRARELAPQDAETAYELARTDLALGDSVNGVPMAQAALAANPRHARAADTLARFYMRMDRPRDALVYLRKAVELDPRSAEAYADLAAVQRALGDKQTALATARQAVALDPASAVARFVLAGILDGTGDSAGAERELRQVIKLDPTAADAMIRLATLLARRPGTLEEVRTLAKQAQETEPGDGAAAGLAAEALYQQGRTTEAMGELQMACTSNPYNFRLWIVFAKHLREQGLNEAADRAMGLALQAIPRAPISASQRKVIAERISKSLKGHEVLPGSAADILAKPGAGITDGDQPGAPAPSGARPVRARR